MKRTLFPIFFTCLVLQLYAQQQPPEIEWTKTFGKSNYDRVYSITNTPDGGYVVAGYTYSKEGRNENILILKLDMTGDMEWNRTFGMSRSEKAFSIINTPDGGYAVAGYTSSKGAGSEDMWILKLDDQGSLIWDKTYGGKYDDKAYSISNTSDSGYVVAGYTMVKSSSTIDMLVLKLDHNGDKVWGETFSGSFRNYANSITTTNDGGCVVAGYIHPSSGDEKYKSDMWRILKLDKTGNTVWDKIFGGDKEDKVKCIIATPDEEYIVAGYTSSKGAGNKDMWIMKLDINGEKLWDKTFGGTAMDGAASIVAAHDGGYVVAGYNESKERYNRDVWILNLDKNGDLAWEKTFGGKMNDDAECVIATPDGGYVLAGYSCTKYNYDSKPVKCKIRIFKLYGTPSKSVENYVRLKINRWQEKGEFEKTQDYQKRVSETNRRKIIEEYTREAANYYGSRKIKLDEASLSKYNADNESFIIHIPNVEEFFIKIPIDEAQSFKLNWPKVQFKNSQYGLVNNRLILEHLDMVINGKIYTCHFSESTGKGNMEFTFKSEDKSQEQSLFRGGGDPLKGLNISKAKSKSKQIGKYYALMIGIDNYKGDWAPLNNAVNDVQTIREILKTKYKFDHFITLYNEEATRENIINKLVWLVDNVKENDNVLIFYSGHGEFNQSLNKGYWVPVDAQTASISNYISNSDIQTFLGGIKSKHTLLVADACFSGDIFRGKTVSVPFEDSEKYYREVYGLISRQAITSGGIEPVMDGGRDGHSVFAYYFIKALNNNKSKYLEATRLYEKIKIPVINNSDQSPKFQSIKNTGDEGGQFIFIKK